MVFLQHGLSDSSATWVINFANQSLAFVLADSGYDVWLGNMRGNTYGRRHETLTPKDEAFWDFSFDEMSDYDLVSMVDYVLGVTNQTQLIYVGHSQGTMIAFAQLSKNSEFAAKIKLFVAMGPVAHLGHIESSIKIFGMACNIKCIRTLKTNMGFGYGCVIHTQKLRFSGFQAYFVLQGHIFFFFKLKFVIISFLLTFTKHCG